MTSKIWWFHCKKHHAAAYFNNVLWCEEHKQLFCKCFSSVHDMQAQDLSTDTGIAFHPSRNHSAPLPGSQKDIAHWKLKMDIAWMQLLLTIWYMPAKLIHVKPACFLMLRLHRNRCACMWTNVLLAAMSYLWLLSCQVKSAYGCAIDYQLKPACGCSWPWLEAHVHALPAWTYV